MEIWDEPVVEFPKRLNIELTNFCNQACVMCPHPEMERTKGMMSPELFRKIVDEASPYGTKVWLHYLGEPLLNPDALSMVEYAKGTRLSSVGFSTNGELLTETLSRRIIESGLDRLEISLDSLDDEEFKRIRKSKSRTYPQVSASIRMFLRMKKEMGRKNPVVSIQFVRLAGKGNGYFDRVRAEWEPYLNPEDFIMCIDPINWADQKVVVPTGSLGKSGDGTGAGFVPVESSRPPCPWLWRNPVIHWNGDVVLCGCDYEGKTVMGNVGRNPLKEIWHSEGYGRVRKAHLARRFDVNPLCGSCTEWKLADFNDRYVNVR